MIRKRATSRHKSDDRDARHIFDLLIKDEFPVLWKRPPESTEALDLMRLRHNLVKQRTPTANRLQALAHQAGLPKGKLTSMLFQESLKRVELGETFAFQRRMLFELWANFSLQIKELEVVLKEYRQLSKKKHTAVAKTAIVRKLLIKLVIMLRDNISAEEFETRGRTVGNVRGAQGLK